MAKGYIRRSAKGKGPIPSRAGWNFGERQHVRHDALCSQEIENLKFQLNHIQSHLERLTDALIDGTIDRDLFQRRKNAVLMQENDLKGRLVSFQAENRQSSLAHLERFLELVNTASFLYKRGLAEEKRDLVKKVTSNLVAGEKNVVVALKNEVNLIAERTKLPDCRLRTTCYSWNEVLGVLLKSWPCLAVKIRLFGDFQDFRTLRRVAPAPRGHMLNYKGRGSAMPINLDLYKAIVRITKTSDSGRHGSLGSGVVFGPTGLVITNNHVIEDADFGTAFGQIKVELLDRVDQPPSKQVPAEIVIRNEIYDLAVLRIIGQLPPYFIDLLATPGGGSSLMERRIRVLGYPPIGGATLTVTRGIVSGFDEAGNLKTDAEINPGNSGGAVLDDFDTFLGIPSFVVSDAGGKLGIIIQLDRIKDWFKSALKSGSPATPNELSRAFVRSNLNFTSDNLGRDNKYARILGKFAAVEDLLERHEYERAIPHISFILEKRPRSALAHHYLGNALLGLGRYIEAADQYQIALTYNPEHVPALGNWGVTLLHLGRRTEALQIFEQAIDRSENPAELWAAYSNIARIYEDSGQKTTANSYREKAAGLRAAVEEWFAERKRRRHPGGKIAALADALVYAEIETGRQES